MRHRPSCMLLRLDDNYVYSILKRYFFSFQKLIVGIFYKTMDEKSQKWFHALGSIYDEFKNHIIFKYEPCMMAEVIQIEYNNMYIDLQLKTYYT